MKRIMKAHNLAAVMEAMIPQGIIQSLCSFSHRKWLASMDIPSI
jgi:hypothetical protein